MLGDDDSGPPEPNNDWDLECGAQHRILVINDQAALVLSLEKVY